MNTNKKMSLFSPVTMIYFPDEVLTKVFSFFIVDEALKDKLIYCVLRNSETEKKLIEDYNLIKNFVTLCRISAVCKRIRNALKCFSIDEIYKRT